MAAKCQIITRSQLEKMDSEQHVESFLTLQDEILGKQTELLQQSENTVIKRRLAIVENKSCLLKSNTKKLNEQLSNVDCCQFKPEQYSRVYLKYTSLY